ncbi:MAG: ABC transporter ATP-binding protein [Desulfobacterales bacterium]
MLLSVDHLVTAFDTDAGRVRAVDDVSFTLRQGTTLGVVGESGCGKSVTALSIMRLLPKPAGLIESGTIRLGTIDITGLPVEEMYRIRGNRIAMIFQEPMTALNPVHRIGRQIMESYELHFPDMSGADRLTAALDLLKKVGIPEPMKRLESYPHQLSGGMRQRVMIAMALACGPEILIADEPTTALDVTIQAQILDLMESLQKETGMSMIFITHDLGVIAELCDDVVVMYAGKVAETAPVDLLFEKPAHPYTRGLLSSIPRLELERKKRLNVIRGIVPALDDLPPGCRFENRCPYAQDICRTAPPPLRPVGRDDHRASCYFAGELDPWSPIDHTGPSTAGASNHRAD